MQQYNFKYNFKYKENKKTTYRVLILWNEYNIQFNLLEKKTTHTQETN